MSLFYGGRQVRAEYARTHGSVVITTDLPATSATIYGYLLRAGEGLVVNNKRWRASRFVYETTHGCGVIHTALARHFAKPLPSDRLCDQMLARTKTMTEIYNGALK